MGRPAVRRAERPRSRQARDTGLIALAVLLLVFALIGIGSAAAYVGGKVSGGSAVPPSSHRNSSTSTSFTAARAEATAIVRAAQVAGRAIVKSSSAKAHRDATAVVTAARQRARRIVSSAVPNTTAPQQSTSVVQANSPPVAAPSTVGVPTGSAAAVGPSLQGVPAAWLIVAYNATFGAGPGSAGGVSVVNRSSHTFSGVVTIRYSHGGVATAPFSGLAAGQSVTLPLNGPHYPGGGYRILVSGLH